MTKTTIEAALKSIKNLEKQVDKLKITNGCLKRNIENTKYAAQETTEILNAIRLVIDTIKGNKL